MSLYSQHTDMSEEMRVETMELCVTACEKFATNNEVRPHDVLSCYAYSFFQLLVVSCQFLCKMKTFLENH